MKAEQKKVEALMVKAIKALLDGQSDFECYDEFLADVFGVECPITIYVYAEQDSTAMLEVSVAYKPDVASGNECAITRSSHKPTGDEAKPWEPWREYQKLKGECARLLLADDNELFRVAVARAAIDAAAGLGAAGTVGRKRL